MFIWLVIIYALLFAFLSWRRFDIALALFFFALPSYLIRFNIGSLPTTLLEVMLWIIFLTWTVRLIKNYKKISLISYLLSPIGKHNKLFAVASTLFLLAATVSIFTSSNTLSALGEWKAFYVEPILLFFILITTLNTQPSSNTQKIFNFLRPRRTRLGQEFSIFKQNPKIPNLKFTIIFALILSGLITAILAIYQHFTGWMVPDAFWTNQNTYRVTAWYGFPNAVGLFLAPIWPLALYLILKNKKQETNKYKKINQKIKAWIFENWNLKIICILYLVSSPLAIYYARSTGALVGLVAGLLFFLFFYNKKTRLIACLVSLVGLVSLVSLPANNPIKQELLFQNRSGQIRLAIWSETWQFLKDNPIWGAGLASYQDKIKPYHTTVNGEGIEIFHHPHNIFLTMWVNAGLAGLIGFMLIIFAIFNFQFSIFKQFKNFSIFNLCILSSLAIILVAGLVDSPYIKNDLAMLFWLLPAMLAAIPHNENEKDALQCVSTKLNP